MNYILKGVKMKKLLFSLLIGLLLFSCSLDQKVNSAEVITQENVRVNRSDSGFELPICKNSSCSNKGNKMTKFVRVIFKNRILNYKQDLNCKDCNISHNHKQIRNLSLNLYQCTVCGVRCGGVKTNSVKCHSDLPSDVVQFPDKKLEDEIRKELGKPEGYLTKDDLLDVIELDMWRHVFGKNLKLDGIGFCENLERLRINFANSIIDLTPLKTLSKLKDLNIAECNVSDISSLRYLVNLKSLRLDRNKISNISSLQHLTKLDKLFMDNNMISDLSPLRNLVELDWLFMNDNKISDISPLSNLKSINKLYLKNNKVENIEAVNDYYFLQCFDIENNMVKSIVPLMNNKKYIYHLVVWDNNMDIRKGTANRAVIDAIIDDNKGSNKWSVNWRSGNIVD